MKFKVVLAVLFLSACRPADVHVSSVRERLEAGEVVTFDKPGYRRPSCKPDAQDWTDIRLKEEDAERQRIVYGSQRSATNPGRHSCFRVGSDIVLNSRDHRDGNGARGRIQALRLVKLEFLKSSHLKGKYFATQSAFSSYRSEIHLSDKDAGIVTIVDIDYVGGTAVDEKDIREKMKQDEDGDGFKQTEKDGDYLNYRACDQTWNVFASEKFHAALKKGMLKSWPSFGENSCYKQGSVVTLSTGKDAPAAAMVKITRVKRFKTDFLKPAYFNYSNDFNFNPLAQELKSTRPTGVKGDWITVVDLEIQ
jgi:hypothetical protein